MTRGAPTPHRHGTTRRAERFYDDQVRDRLLPAMIDFIGRMEMLFVATADAHGECDASFRAGPPESVRVLDESRLAYPEYRGNGVMASLGNLSENPHVGLLMMDFARDRVGLHVNGRAEVVEVEEAYIHCRKHIPRMVPAPIDRDWGTDDVRSKGGDYFGAARERAASPPPTGAD